MQPFVHFDSASKYLILIGQHIVDHAVSYVPLRSRKCTHIIRYVVLRGWQSVDTVLSCMKLKDWPGIICTLSCVAERPAK